MANRMDLPREVPTTSYDDQGRAIIDTPKLSSIQEKTKELKESITSSVSETAGKALDSIKASVITIKGLFGKAKTKLTKSLNATSKKIKEKKTDLKIDSEISKLKKNEKHAIKASATKKELSIKAANAKATLKEGLERLESDVDGLFRSVRAHLTLPSRTKTSQNVHQVAQPKLKPLVLEEKTSIKQNESPESKSGIEELETLDIPESLPRRETKVETQKDQTHIEEQEEEVTIPPNLYNPMKPDQTRKDFLKDYPSNDKDMLNLIKQFSRDFKEAEKEFNGEITQRGILMLIMNLTEDGSKNIYLKDKNIHDELQKLLFYGEETQNTYIRTLCSEIKPTLEKFPPSSPKPKPHAPEQKSQEQVSTPIYEDLTKEELKPSSPPISQAKVQEQSNIEKTEAHQEVSPKKTETQSAKEKNFIPADLYGGKEFNELRENYLYTYRWYTDTPGLINRLSQDYQKAKDEGNDLQKNGILQVLRTWIKEPKFNQNEYLKPEIEQQLKDLINQINHDENFKTQSAAVGWELANSIALSQKTIEEQKKTDISVRPTALFRTKAERRANPNPAAFVKDAVLERSGKKMVTTDSGEPSAIVKKGTMKPGRKSARYEANVEAFEHDMGLWAQHLMAKVEISEFKTDITPEKSPNLLKMVDEFNKLSKFVVFSILDQGISIPEEKPTDITKTADKTTEEPPIQATKEQIENAAKTIEYFIDVAEKALENHNLFTFMAIAAALGTSQIFRMKSVWNKVSPDRRVKSELYTKWAAGENNFKELRNNIPEIDNRQGSTPPLTMYLVNLNAANEKIPAYVNEQDANDPSKTNQVINLERIKTFASLTKELYAFKPTETIPKDFTINPGEIGKYTERLVKDPKKTDDVADRLSQALYPRVRTPSKSS